MACRRVVASYVVRRRILNQPHPCAVLLIQMRIYRSRLEMSVAELVRVRGQKSHDFCYRKNQIAHGIDIVDRTVDVAVVGHQEPEVPIGPDPNGTVVVCCARRARLKTGEGLDSDIDLSTSLDDVLWREEFPDMSSTTRCESFQ